MSHSKEEKLQEIYARTNRQIRKSNIYFVVAASLFISAIVVGSFSDEYFSPPYNYIVSGGAIAAVLGCMFLAFYALNIRPSYEKSLFRQIFSIHRDLAGYLKISDTSTFRKKNLDFVILPLNSLSRKLGKKKLEGNSDLVAETNRKYAEIGKYIKTKIIAYLQEEKDIAIVERRILRLADVFSDMSMAEVNSYIESLKDIPDKDFQGIPSKFDTIRTGIASNPLLRICGKYVACLAFVIIVAYPLSMVLSKPLADWGGYIIVASFALLAAVEFGGR